MDPLYVKTRLELGYNCKKDLETAALAENLLSLIRLTLFVFTIGFAFNIEESSIAALPEVCPFGNSANNIAF